MLVNASAAIQPLQHQPEPRSFERDAAQPKIDRRPGEPFDIRKADIEIQRRWVLSEVTLSH